MFISFAAYKTNVLNKDSNISSGCYLIKNIPHVQIKARGEKEPYKDEIAKKAATLGKGLILKQLGFKKGKMRAKRIPPRGSCSHKWVSKLDKDT